MSQGQDSPGGRISVVVGDITQLDIDVIVNAANESLLPGGGVCGAIHRAAGPELERACRALGHCPTGSAVMTPGFSLKARHVIHAVGPVWHGGGAGEAALLRGCYERAMTLAAEAGAGGIAFPAISAGIFGYPRDQAAAVAVSTIATCLAGLSRAPRVVFCCFEEPMAATYRRQLAAANVA